MRRRDDMPTTMKEAVAAVKRTFDSNGWRYEYDAERYVFRIRFSLEKAKLGGVEIVVRCAPSPDDADVCFLIASFGRISMNADDKCKVQVSEYLTRVNYGLVLGNFEMDFSDGEISFRYACNVLDSMIGEDALDDLTTLPVEMYEKYGNGLLSVLTGVMTPAAAFARAEEEKEE